MRAARGGGDRGAARGGHQAGVGPQAELLAGRGGAQRQHQGGDGVRGAGQPLPAGYRPGYSYHGIMGRRFPDNFLFFSTTSNIVFRPCLDI